MIWKKNEPQTHTPLNNIDNNMILTDYYYSFFKESEAKIP